MKKAKKPFPYAVKLTEKKPKSRKVTIAYDIELTASNKPVYVASFGGKWTVEMVKEEFLNHPKRFTKVDEVTTANG